MYVVYPVGISYHITNHITGLFTVRLPDIIFYLFEVVSVGHSMGRWVMGHKYDGSGGSWVTNV